MPGYELLPSGLPVALGRWFHTMLLQNVGDGAARHFMAQIGQCALYSSVAPIPVLSGHADHQLLDLILHMGAPRAAPSTAIVFSGDQFAVPSQKGLRRDDGGQFMERAPAQFLGLDG